MLFHGYYAIMLIFAPIFAFTLMLLDAIFRYAAAILRFAICFMLIFRHFRLCCHAAFDAIISPLSPHYYAAAAPLFHAADTPYAAIIIAAMP